MSKKLPKKRRSTAQLWRNAFLTAIGLCGIALCVNIALSEVRPSSPWGLGFGIAATVMLLLVSLYGARRRLARLALWVPLGSSRAWLYLHLYGGSLFLLLMLMHSGFAIPSGLVTFWLWLLSLWTVLSGFVGLALQKWLPRALGSGLDTEVLYERIPALVDEIRSSAETLVAEASDPIKNLYSRRLAPGLAAPERRLLFFVDISGGSFDQLREIEFLQSKMPEKDHQRLEELAGLIEAKRQIDAQYTLQWPLRIWPILHVPTSLMVWALLIVHLFSIQYY